MWPHRWQPIRIPHPWHSPGKNTGVGCHFLLQCMNVKIESEVAQSCLMSKTSQILSFSFKTWDPGTRLCYIIISGKNMWSISIFLIFPIKNENKSHLWVSEKRTWALPLLHPPSPISSLTHSQCGYRSRTMWSCLIGAQQYPRESRCFGGLVFRKEKETSMYGQWTE